MNEHITDDDRKNAIRIYLTNRLNALGLNEFAPKAIDRACTDYDAGNSAWRSINRGLVYARMLKQTWLN